VILCNLRLGVVDLLGENEGCDGIDVAEDEGLLKDMAWWGITHYS
jgi:hypothetical protein